jgi:ribosomal protein S18 acetylase RimI-like enzyme
MTPNGIVHRLYIDQDKRDFLDYRWGSGNTVEIYDIEVGSDRRRGRGRALVSILLASVEDQNVTVWAITRAENRIAHEFYWSLGFRVVAPLYEFYDGGCRRVDALMFGRRAGGRV